jgi:hypothetical protein
VVTLYKHNAGEIAKIQYFGIYQSLVQSKSESLRNPTLRLYLTVEGNAEKPDKN